jgi:hypothetical protein
MNRMKFNSEIELIKATLDKVGYDFMKPTEENLRECFYDYVCCGVWSNISYDDEDLNEYSTNSICRNLWKLR